MKPGFCSGQVAFTIFFLSIYFSCAYEFPTGHHVPELQLVFFQDIFSGLIHDWNSS